MTDDGWVDRGAFPFEPRFFTGASHRMHYVDEGEGPAVVMVHGTPTWSFLFRQAIRELSRDHRVIALDHVGFGLSEKPATAELGPREHAGNLAALIEHLGLRDLVLVVHDFGGPIGLSYGLENPGDVRGLVLLNTWMWSLRGSPGERVARLLGGRMGRFLYERMNLSPRTLLPAGFGDRSKLTKDVHRQYLAPFPSSTERLAPWVLARELLGSSDWYEALWTRRERIADKPALLLWGMKDPAFRPEVLKRWQGFLARAETVEFPDAGHFVLEESPGPSVAKLGGFVRSLP